MTRATALSLVLVLTSSTVAMATPSSGMLLGIYCFPNWRGLRVTGTMPDYSAHGKLFRDDVLTRVTPDGNSIFSARTLHELEFAKDQIGPFRQAALEVFRPGIGFVYLWVEFRPIGGGGIGYSKMQARIMTEQEKPGAAKLFQRSGDNGNFRPKPGAGGSGGSGGAGSLFGNP